MEGLRCSAFPGHSAEQLPQLTQRLRLFSTASWLLFFNDLYSVYRYLRRLRPWNTSIVTLYCILGHYGTPGQIRNN